MVYIGSDVDLAVLHYLEDIETHAVYVDPMGEPEERTLFELAKFEAEHRNDPRVSWRRSTRDFRPWHDSMRRAFR